MKNISVFFISILFFLNCSQLYAEDALTIKQELDRIVEEVKDLNKAVFNKSFDKSKVYSNEDNDDIERFTSIDIRIYDLEKDIKNLTLQFEEILFRLDDISKKMNSVEVELINKFETLQYNLNNSSIVKNKEVNIIELSDTKEENILGNLVISNNDKDLKNINSENIIEENQSNKQDKEFENLSPEEILQFALDQMMKKSYENSKLTLENFILDFPENQLSGSAHFWLGKIFIFESNYRKAAIVFGEGVQKFPNSIKAAEMYYELSKSLIEMDKITEACKTLALLDENYKGNKYTKDPEKIKHKLKCES